jgi:hypothetical protein
MARAKVFVPLRGLSRVVSRLTLSAAMLTAACGGSSQSSSAKAAGQTAPGGNDQSRCDYKGRSDREVVESNGPGAAVPNVRRVFGILGEGEDRRRVLFCREIDTNLDGVKDVVRRYNEKGDAVDEQADSDYDNKIDTWIRFSGGRISKEERDRNRDGRPDETRYYVKGKLNRVQRDTNFDSKPDVWEVYGDGQLERMGTDIDYDGHVDRWDRDEVAHRVAEEKERQEEEKTEVAKKAQEAADAAASKPTRPQDAGKKPPAAAGSATPPASSAATPPASSDSSIPDLASPKKDVAGTAKSKPKTK